MNTSTHAIRIHKYINNQSVEMEDTVAVEEPLEISIAFYKNTVQHFKNISVTMRTPGNDKELALGFLFTENIINSILDVEKVEKKGDNKICIYLQRGIEWQQEKIERHFYTTSSCGVCGKASIEAVRTLHDKHIYPIPLNLPSQTILSLKNTLSNSQIVFQHTGGIHAATLFDQKGNYIHLFEDVGRHNALDKLIGHNLFTNQLPLHQHILLLSGRASFELIQKAATASIQIICAFGAPSSLAIELAEEFDITLIGFLKDTSFNIYSGHEKIII